MKQLCIMVVAIVTALASSFVLPDELPSFKPGLWEFTRTMVQPAQSADTTKPVRQCTDPIVDMKRKWAALISKGCRFTAIKRVADRYSYSSSCPANGQLVNVKSVVQVLGEDSYQVTTEMHRGAELTETLIIARREGDCGKQ
jgi:hypothetical protein